MLILTRRLGEEIVIDDNIRVTFLAVRGKTIRLGIAAPRSVRITRSELLERECATEERETGNTLLPDQ